MGYRKLTLQPFNRFAEVLLAGIERDAGEFSVPSKVLSYLSVGRPVVLSAQRDNLAARILLETGAGAVVEPEDVAGFAAAARRYAADPDAACRAHAAAHFRIDRLAQRFEGVLGLHRITAV